MRVSIQCVLLGLAAYSVALGAYAQHTDKSFTTTAEDCASVRWSEDVLKRYPNIAPACQSVEHHDGVEYVKFTGTVVRTRNQGKQLTLNLKDGGQVTVDMPENTSLSIDGKPTPLARLRQGDKLNFYIPQNRVAAEFYAQDQPQTAAPSIEAPIEPTVPPVVATQEPEQRVARLPSTASDLPLLALIGAMLIALGAALTGVRRNRS